MVKITPEEVLEQRQHQKNMADLTHHDLKVIGRSVRIEIPFTNTYNMREIAGLLRRYADQLDVYSHRTDLPQRSILMHLKWEAKAVNDKIREMHKNCYGYQFIRKNNSS